MRIFVNGDPKEVSDVDNVTSLVRGLELTPSTVLVEQNGVALLRSEWDRKSVTAGDRFEILLVVAGG